MSELKRWLDQDPPPQVRRLLEVGQWDRPSRAVLEQVVERARTASAPGAEGGLLMAEPRSALRASIKWLLMGILILGGLAALAVSTSSEQFDAQQRLRPGLVSVARQSPRSALSVDPSAALDNDGAASAAMTSSVPVEALPTQEQEAPVASTAKPGQQHAAVVSPRGKVCKPAVAQQIAILEEASAAIRSGREVKALALLNRYDGFGKGRCFVLESLKHRMDAYRRQGNLAGARRSARAILSGYPGTAQAREARALLEE